MLRQGNVQLIGEAFPQLALGAPSPVAQPGPAGHLATQLADPSAGFARIYGFSFEGHYYDLPKPVIMLVHGAGSPVTPGSPVPIAETDEAARDWEFSGGLSQWNYDKTTVSVRLDIESGTLEQILLEATLSGTSGSYAGAQARISGAQARISGAQARIAGAQARIRNRDGNWSD
jgi:hypothetical protein